MIDIHGISTTTYKEEEISENEKQVDSVEDVHPVRLLNPKQLAIDVPYRVKRDDQIWKQT